MLLPGAVPTQFPSLPKYLSKQLPQNRKRPARSAPAAPPSQQCANNSDPLESAESEEPSRSFSIKNFAVPSAAWGKHTLSVSPRSVAHNACGTAHNKHVLLTGQLALLSLGCIARSIRQKSEATRRRM
ncbi:hypothetical protein HPB48_016142 [Haemaphysalis longicornis]|uniref:Uncharacterized protein n=1 Tax=Haemaphysalis longicornis TaxID=44386 RepID=A0A9J6FEC4_HAELO|nr:hypothetical protein HPB48_016142 [Haemaphysalis longicornis]